MLSKQPSSKHRFCRVGGTMAFAPKNVGLNAGRALMVFFYSAAYTS